MFNDNKIKVKAKLIKLGKDNKFDELMSDCQEKFGYSLDDYVEIDDNNHEIYIIFEGKNVETKEISTLNFKENEPIMLISQNRRHSLFQKIYQNHYLGPILDDINCEYDIDTEFFIKFKYYLYLFCIYKEIGEYLKEMRDDIVTKKLSTTDYIHNMFIEKTNDELSREQIIYHLIKMFINQELFEINAIYQCNELLSYDDSEHIYLFEYAYFCIMHGLNYYLKNSSLVNLMIILKANIRFSLLYNHLHESSLGYLLEVNNRQINIDNIRNELKVYNENLKEKESQRIEEIIKHDVYGFLDDIEIEKRYKFIINKEIKLLKEVIRLQGYVLLNDYANAKSIVYDILKKKINDNIDPIVKLAISIVFEKFDSRYVSSEEKFTFEKKYINSFIEWYKFEPLTRVDLISFDNKMQQYPKIRDRVLKILDDPKVSALDENNKLIFIKLLSDIMNLNKKARGYYDCFKGIKADILIDNLLKIINLPNDDKKLLKKEYDVIKIYSPYNHKYDSEVACALSALQTIMPNIDKSDIVMYMDFLFDVYFFEMTNYTDPYTYLEPIYQDKRYKLDLIKIKYRNNELYRNIRKVTIYDWR